MVGERADPETLARLRAELHLDDPLHVQFVRYVGGVARATSAPAISPGGPYSRICWSASRHPPPGRRRDAVRGGDRIGIGIYGAWRPGSWPDRLSALGAYLGVSFPVYWVGLILILVFAVHFRWLPPSGSGGPAYLILPALALGMRSVAFLSRMTRAAMQEVLQSDFVRTARAKGLGEGRVVLSHAFRNALLPVVTVLGLDFGSYLTGSILTETIFSGPAWGDMCSPPSTSVTSRRYRGASSFSAWYSCW
jgi:ABC-type dipeptide/oligopeptide/nickel transport system permease component